LSRDDAHQAAVASERRRSASWPIRSTGGSAIENGPEVFKAK
jgi:hypothetical protein